MGSADLLLHPVRLRIVKAFLGERALTTTQLAAELDDVPSGSLYRHVALLTKAGVLQVVAERRVRGAVERTYTLRLFAARLDPDAVQAMTTEEHGQAFMAYVAGMLGPDGPIQVTATGRRLGRLVVRAPLPFLPAPVAWLMTLPAVALLPPRIRDAYGLAWGPGHARLARLLDRAVRLWVHAMPRAWRAMPQARAADARAARLAARYDRRPHPRSEAGRA